MPSYPRHVHTVRLNAPSEALVKRGAILLEDALHTASLPGIEDGRLLIIRSLNLGNIDTRQSTASLALIVEKRLWQLSSTAIYAEDPAANTALAVYFRDETEPYICLAKRLAQQASTNAWFWSKAIPDWQPHLSRNEALQRLIYGVIQTRTGVAEVVALMTELLEVKAIDPLLSALNGQDGATLLRDCGWFQPDLAIAFVEPLATRHHLLSNSAWFDLLQRWTRRWGADDTRSIWLTAIALISEKPARVLDPRLMYQAQQLIKQLTSCADVLEAGDKETRAQGDKETTAQGDNRTKAQEDNGTKRQPHKGTREQEDNRTRGQENKETTAQGDKKYKTIGHLGKFHSNPDINWVQTELPESVIENTPLSSLHPVEKWSEIPSSTDYAGLFFLFPLLNCLDIAAFLESHPDFIELDLPRRLLHAVGQRLRIPAHDPLWAVLNEMDFTTNFSDSEFIAPANWRQGVLQSGTFTIHSVADNINTQVLLDGSRRLTLALWQGKAGDRLQDLIGENHVITDNSVVIQTDNSVIIHSWLTAMRRWCRRYARMGLQDLVHRPGRVLITRTHVDILFNHQQADIRIRRVGLDINPGWVPWFGRVVAFDYLYGE